MSKREYRTVQASPVNGKIPTEAIERAVKKVKKEREAAISNLWQPEFYDILKVLEFGVEKHGHSNWLDPNGRKSSEKNMLESIGRHWAEAHTGKTDHETNLDPLLHLACRALMLYTRRKRGIVHQDD